MIEVEKTHKFELGLKAFAAMDLKWGDIPKNETGSVGSPVDFKEFSLIQFTDTSWQATTFLKVVRFDDDLYYSKFAVIFDGTPVMMIERRIAVDQWTTFLRRIAALESVKMIEVRSYEDLNKLEPEEAAIFEDIMVAAYNFETSNWRQSQEDSLKWHITGKLKGYIHGRMMR